MKRTQLYALGQDPYWLKAMDRIADDWLVVNAIQCPDGYPECLVHLPEADPEAMVLVDATNQADVISTVRYLRGQRWQYVVVVAADPAWKQARELLRGGLAFDYWHKSYESTVIRRSIERCLAEIERNR